MPFCNLCGKALAENETCNCSVQTNTQKPAEVPPYNYQYTPYAPPPKKKFGIGPFILFAVVFVITILVTTTDIFKNKGHRPEEDYELPLLLIEKAYEKSDYEYCLNAVLPQVCYDFLKRELGYAWDSAFEQTQESFDDSIDRLEESMGGYPSVEFYIKNAEEITDSSLANSMHAKYCSSFDIDYPDFQVTEAYELECTMELSGGKKSADTTIDILVFKTGGEWYVDINSFMALLR